MNPQDEIFKSVILNATPEWEAAFKDANPRQLALMTHAYMEIRIQKLEERLIQSQMYLTVLSAAVIAMIVFKFW